jgi:nucleoside-diphosphate-sugar epimerase
MPKLIFGCGYLGLRTAKRWQQEDETVYGVTRSAARAKEFSQMGLRPLIADISRPETLANLPDAETVLFSVGFDRQAERSIFDIYVSGLGHVLDALSGSVRRVIYISSSGVFGQTDGDWVTEGSPCRPTREGGIACLAAEDLLRAHPLGQRAIILRLAGLYGPGRIPRRDDLVQGRPIAAPSDGYLNLIHVDDAAAIVVAAEKHANPPATYLVSDGSPVLRREYYAELARLVGAPPPRYEAAPSDSPAARRATSDKRISNARLRSEIPFTLAYPSYREGLAAIVSQP